jgi:hypothetical protein
VDAHLLHRHVDVVGSRTPARRSARAAACRCRCCCLRLRTHSRWRPPRGWRHERLGSSSSWERPSRTVVCIDESNEVKATDAALHRRFET